MMQSSAFSEWMSNNNEQQQQQREEKTNLYQNILQTFSIKCKRQDFISQVALSSERTFNLFKSWYGCIDNRKTMKDVKAICII